jgi:DNA-binding PadR family transcriptional regulator
MTTLRYVVLGLLRDGQARHGYALRKSYQARTGRVMTAGSVYRVLHGMRRDGLIQRIPITVDEDPRRAPHRITPRGVRTFDGWLASGDDLADPDEGLAIATRAVFLADTPHAAARLLLDRWQEQLRLRHTTLERERPPRGPAPAAELTTLSLLDARRTRMLAAEREFLEDLRRAYLQWTGAPAPATQVAAAH